MHIVPVMCYFNILPPLISKKKDKQTNYWGLSGCGIIT
jgi:hypothetical protein